MRATGRTKASLESMTHGAIYSVDESIRCVLHFHNRKIFDSMLLDGTVPKTKKDVEYGTPRMASAMDQIVRSRAKKPRFFATEGHDEGVFAYGPSIEEALAPNLRLASQVRLRIAERGIPPLFFRTKKGSILLKIAQCQEGK